MGPISSGRPYVCLFNASAKPFPTGFCLQNAPKMLQNAPKMTSSACHSWVVSGMIFCIFHDSPCERIELVPITNALQKVSKLHAQMCFVISNMLLQGEPFHSNILLPAAPTAPFHSNMLLQGGTSHSNILLHHCLCDPRGDFPQRLRHRAPRLAPQG